MCDGATQCASKSEASVEINTLGLLFRQGLSHRLRRGSHRECKSMEADEDEIRDRVTSVYLKAREFVILLGDNRY
jgi:hypothetical protein